MPQDQDALRTRAAHRAIGDLMHYAERMALKGAEERLAALVGDVPGLPAMPGGGTPEGPRAKRRRATERTTLTHAEQVILGALKAAVPDALPIPTLMLLVWPEEPAKRSPDALFQHVSRLRKVLRATAAQACVVTFRREDGSAAYGLAKANGTT